VTLLKEVYKVMMVTLQQYPVLIELDFVQRKLYVKLEELKKTVTAFIEYGLGDLCRQT